MDSMKVEVKAQCGPTETDEDASGVSAGKEAELRKSSDKGDKQALGKKGEAAAARYLERQGYEIIERNWHCDFGEADLIAFDEDVLVFVEVKTRSNLDKGLPEEAVTPRKRSKYERIAASYLQTGDFADCPIRFDVIALLALGNGHAMLRHHKSAFSSGE